MKLGMWPSLLIRVDLLVCLTTLVITVESAEIVYILPNGVKELPCPSGTTWFHSNRTAPIANSSNPVGLDFQSQFSVNYTGSDLQLTILNMSADLEQNELVCCSVEQNCSRTSPNVVVSVILRLVRVQNAEIKDTSGSIMTTMRLREGQQLILYCSSDCVPICLYNWMCVNTDGDTVFSKDKNETITSQINRSNASCICNASATVNGTYLSTSAKVTFIVSYPPEIRIKASTGVLSNYTDHIVAIEGTSSLNLTCEIVTPGHPSEYSYNWTGSDALLSAKPELSFTPTVMRSDANNFTCLVSNDGGTSQSTIELSVNYLPTLELGLWPEMQRSHDLIWKQARLCCNISDKTPSISTSDSIEWRKDDYLLEFKDAFLDILEPIIKVDAGVYSCSLNTSMGNVTAEFQLQVAYVDNVFLFVTINDGSDRIEVHNDLIISEGDSLHLEYTAVCFPSCSFELSCHNMEGDVSFTAPYTLTNITRSLWCRCNFWFNDTVLQSHLINFELFTSFDAGQNEREYSVTVFVVIIVVVSLTFAIIILAIISFYSCRNAYRKRLAAQQNTDQCNSSKS